MYLGGGQARVTPSWEGVWQFSAILQIWSLARSFVIASVFAAGYQSETRPLHQITPLTHGLGCSLGTTWKYFS